MAKETGSDAEMVEGATNDAVRTCRSRYFRTKPIERPTCTDRARLTEEKSQKLVRDRGVWIMKACDLCVLANRRCAMSPTGSRHCGETRSIAHPSPLMALYSSENRGR